ncbi:MAG TPA: hypothetical protein VHF87_03605 [Methylomirabilota bacterium]|nr:hypothetical protein [Methylomirabilota bacterium]
MSLGRLSQRQGKRDQAREVLRDTVDSFSEGVDTGDLGDARGLLAELS